MKTQLLTAALLFGLPSFAFAADHLVDDALVVDSTYNWSGAYLGLIAGVESAESRVDFAFQFSNPDPKGLTGGLMAGANYQFENGLVIGVDANFSLSSADADGRVFATLGDGEQQEVTNVTAHQDVKWSGAVRGRLGYAVGRVLPFVTAGASAMRVDTVVEIPPPPFGIGNAYSDETYLGWTVGGGADFAVTDHVFFRAEYAYSDFGSSESFELPGPEIFGAENEAELKSSHAIRLGIAYKF